MEQSDQFLGESLDNGIEVVGQPMAGVESAAFGILIGTGARDENPDKFGVSHFTEQMLFRGTDRFDARQLSENFDALGASYDSSAGVEMTVLHAVLLGDRLPKAIDLLAEVTVSPTFPEGDIESVRTLLLQELFQREDQPAQKVMDLLRQKFFAGNPVSHDVLGNETTIQALERNDLVGYWSSRYTANNVVVSIAGNFDWDAILDRLRSATASWRSGSGRSVIEAPVPQPNVMVLQREATQENIGFAFPCVAVSDPDYYAASLLSLALGGSTHSRLFREVRDERGLAYAVQSRFDGLEKTGLMRIYVGTSAERAHESVEVVLNELRKLEEGGITEDELAVAKTRLKSQLVMRSESTSARMISNMRTWWYERRLRSLDDIKNEIDAVSVEQIAALIERLNITQKLGAVALGPRSEEELFGAMLARS